LLHHLRYPTEGSPYPQLDYDPVFGHPWAILGKQWGRQFCSRLPQNGGGGSSNLNSCASI